jgi:hypothetical protein
MDFFADNALVLRSEGLVIAFKGVQKGYWTFSKPYGRGLHRFIASPEMRIRLFMMNDAIIGTVHAEACRKFIDVSFGVAILGVGLL